MNFDIAITDAEGAVCVQTVSMAVVAGCDVFSNLVWSEIFTTGNAAGLFTGPSWSLVSSGTCTNDDSALISDGHYQAVGTYNGPAANCNLHLTGFGGGPIGLGGASHHDVTITFDGSTIISNGIEIEPTFFLGPGAYDLPFNIPDTGGISKSVVIDVYWGSGLIEVAETGGTNMLGGGQVTSACAP